MATYSNNTTIKVNSGITASNPMSGATSGTLYTVPANSYAILNFQIYSPSSWPFTVTISGVNVGQAINNTAYAYSIHAGPGQVISWSYPLPAFHTGVQMQGVLFTNTP